MATPPAAATVTVALPLLGDALRLVDAVTVLAGRWPSSVDARLVVPAPVLGARDRSLLAELGDEVQVLEVTGTPGFGELAAAAAADGSVLVLDPTRLPDAAALAVLAAGGDAEGGLHLTPAALAELPVLTAARDLPGLRALATLLTPLPEEDAGEAGEVREPSFDGLAPARPGLVSVVVPVWNQLEHTRACLASVRRSTPAPYEIVVVDNGSTDGTRAWLAAQRDLVVVTNAENRGFAAACNQGIAASRGETVVLLNNDTVVPRFWVEGLRRALDTDSRVGAVGPRSNSVSGHQLVPGCDYDAAGFRAYADTWRRSRAGRTEEVRRLVGFCLALRREALLEVGGLDEGYGTGNFEDDDLCLRLRRAGWSLRVAHEVLVHHAGSATFRAAGSYSAAFAHGYRHHRAKWGASLGEDVLLSAALIVKDEQQALPRCLAALRGVVDELVVCDTGSSDRTVEVAQAFGATVVHAPWEGDFAAARNAVLAHCRGTWVLSVDADEQLRCAEGADLRLQLLAVEAQALAVQVRSRSDDDGEASYEHAAGRLFRRGDLSWVGAVHETLVDRRTGRPPTYRQLGGVWLDHDGYVGRVYEERDKATRNLLLAEKDHERALATGDEGRVWKTAYELARALSRDDDTAERVEELMGLALERMPARVPHLRCDALVRTATAQARQGRLQDAEASAAAGLAVRPGDPAALLVLGQVLSATGRHAEALRLLDEAPALGDDALQDLGKRDLDLPLLRARLLHRTGRSDEAATALLSLTEQAAAPALDWPLLRDVLATRADGTTLLAGLVARDPAPALAALDGLPTDERAALHLALAELGVDAAAHTPQALRAARLDDVLRGHDPQAVAAAALALEDSDLPSALDLWRRLPTTPDTQVARARCLLQLGRTDEAVDAVEGLDLGLLGPAELLVVVAVAGAAGDLGTAQQLLDAVHETHYALAPGLREHAERLAATLGLGLPDRVDR